MKCEIKEIDITKDLYLCSPLLNTECSKENCYINNGPCCHAVNKEYSQQYLLDYITNLQEENNRLKELCDKYEEEHNTAFKLWTIKMEEMHTYEEKKELQNRIDKAVDKIQNMIESNKAALSNPEHTIVAKHKLLKSDNDDCEYLLNILQGKSDE